MKNSKSTVDVNQQLVRGVREMVQGKSEVDIKARQREFGTKFLKVNGKEIF